MDLPAKKIRGIVLSDNLSSVLIVVIFSTLIVNCLFIDKGYYDTMPQDLFGFLDGIYRTHLGQIPHRDFSTTYGTIQFLAPSLFLYFDANLVSSVRYYHVLLLVVAACIVLYIQRTRVQNFLSVVFGGVVALALACKYNFGDSPFQITEAMLYNRIGFVFITIELVLFINPTCKRSIFDEKTLSKIDAVLIGLICGFLFYVKFPFGIIAIGFTFMNLLADDRTWQSKVVLFGGSIAVFILIVGIVELWLGGNFTLYRDARMAMLSDSGRRMAIILRRVIVDIPEIIIAIIVPLLIIWAARVKLRIYWVLYASAITLSSILLQIYSFQESVLFLPLAFILFATSKIYVNRSTLELNYRTPYFNAMVIVSLLASANLAYPMMVNVILASIRYHYAGSRLSTDNDTMSAIHTIPLRVEADHFGKLISPQAVAALESAPMLDAYAWARKSRPAYYYDELSFPEYGFYLTDGMNAATSGCRKGARIATLDSVNPFPALLGWPEGGGMVFVSAPELLSESYHLKPEEMLRQIDCVLIPKTQADVGTREVLTSIYGKYLNANYSKSTETVLWTVLTLRTSSSRL
jgi:hypothetical protein